MRNSRVAGRSAVDGTSGIARAACKWFYRLRRCDFLLLFESNLRSWRAHTHV